VAEDIRLHIADNPMRCAVSDCFSKSLNPKLAIALLSVYYAVALSTADRVGLVDELRGLDVAILDDAPAAGRLTVDHKEIAEKARGIAHDEVEEVKAEDRKDRDAKQAKISEANRVADSPAVRKIEDSARKQTKELQAQVADIRAQRSERSGNLDLKAEKAVMQIYHQEAQKLLTHGDGPDHDPFAQAGARTHTLGPWLASDPLLVTPQKKERRMTMMDDAVDKAERKAAKSSDADAQVYKAVADEIKRVSNSGLGKELEVMASTGSLLTQKKARAAMRLVIYKAYDDGMGKHGNAYRRAYVCQKAIKAALDAMALQNPTLEQQQKLCQNKLFEAESKLRIEAALGAALVVAQRTFAGSEQCEDAKEVDQHMKIAQFEVNAVKKACPDMSVKTEGPGKGSIREKIRSTIAEEMALQLKKPVESHKKDDAQSEVDKVMASAEQAWKDVNEFSVGSEIPKGLDIYPSSSDPDMHKKNPERGENYVGKGRSAASSDAKQTQHPKQNPR